MFDEKMQKFLNANGACLGGITRLQDIGVETLEQAWDKASDDDLIWAITRPSVMDPEQRRLFLVMVLESIEDKLTDPRSLNILTKLRTNEPITDEDMAAASAAALAASNASWTAARAAMAAMVAMAAWAARAASDASDASDSSDSMAAQANWVRKNFKLCDLHIN